MIYLASPYSHADPAVMEDRYLAALHALTVFLQARKWAISPIVHCHHLAKRADLPKSAEFWRDYDLEMFMACDSLAVLCLEGWKESVGVMQEIRWAEEFHMPIQYVTPVEVTP